MLTFLRSTVSRPHLRAATGNILARACSTSTATADGQNLLKYERDPAGAFLDPATQKLLKSMTRLRLDKVYRKRAVTNNKVEYKFMTTEQIEDEVRSSISKAEALLQMPPVMNIGEVTHKTISRDPALQSHDTATFVFTDITFGIPDAQRTIVVRQPDGTLENATPAVRKRMNQIYFPTEGRRFRTPALFEPEHLRRCMAEHRYEFILDRSCVQFEPFEAEYHAVAQQVYAHLQETGRFDLLRSTRHFGPMCFFYAWHRQCDDLLVDMVRHDYLHNAVELICLSYRLNGIQFDERVLERLEQLKQRKAASMDANMMALGLGELQQDIEARVGKTVEDFEIDGLCFGFVQEFNRLYAVKKSVLEAALQTYGERNAEKRRLFDGLQKAHGVSC